MQKRRSMKKVILIILSILIILVMGYATYLYVNFNSTMETIHTPIIIEETPTSTTYPSTQEALQKNSSSPITILLLGIDQFENSVGRADTILVLTVNPQTETIQMLSIPRDTYTEIVGLNFYDKINHSYAFGGVAMATQTVSNFLQIPIDYVVSINMEGFIDLVDTLNGINIENKTAFSTDYNNFSEGQIHLTGDAALDFVRMRYEDPLGDFGRQNRQRLVIESLLKKLSSLNIIWQVPSVLETIRHNVETNITTDDISTFLKQYKPALNHIEQITFTDGEGRLENDIWYYFVSEEELQQIRKQLKDSISFKQ